MVTRTTQEGFPLSGEVCDRAVNLPCYETPKEQRKKNKLLAGRRGTANPGREGNAQRTWMVISLISWESWEGSEWDFAAANAAHWSRHLKRHRASSWC